MKKILLSVLFIFMGVSTLTAGSFPKGIQDQWVNSRGNSWDILSFDGKSETVQFYCKKDATIELINTWGASFCDGGGNTIMSYFTEFFPNEGIKAGNVYKLTFYFKRLGGSVDLPLINGLNDYGCPASDPSVPSDAKIYGADGKQIITMTKAAYVMPASTDSFSAIPDKAFKGLDIIIIAFADVTKSTMDISLSEPIKKMMDANPNAIYFLSVGGGSVTGSVLNSGSINTVVNNVDAQIKAFNNSSTTKITGVDLDIEYGITSDVIAGLAKGFKGKGYLVSAGPQLFVSSKSNSNVDPANPSNLVFTSGYDGNSCNNDYLAAITSGNLDYLFVQGYNASGFKIGGYFENQPESFYTMAQALSTLSKQNTSSTQAIIPSNLKIFIGMAANQGAGGCTIFNPDMNKDPSGYSPYDQAKILASLKQQINKTNFPGINGVFVWSLNNDYMPYQLPDPKQNFAGILDKSAVSGAFCDVIFDVSNQAQTTTATQGQNTANTNNQTQTTNTTAQTQTTTDSNYQPKSDEPSTQSKYGSLTVDASDKTQTLPPITGSILSSYPAMDKAAYVELTASSSLLNIPDDAYKAYNIIIFAFADAGTAAINQAFLTNMQKITSLNPTATYFLSIGGETGTVANFPNYDQTNIKTLDNIVNNIRSQIYNYNKNLTAAKITGVDLDLENGIDGATIRYLGSQFKLKGLLVSIAPQVYRSPDSTSRNIDSANPTNLILTSGAPDQYTKAENSYDFIINSRVSGNIPVLDYIFVQPYNSSGFTIDNYSENQVPFFSALGKALNNCTSLSKVKILIGQPANQCSGNFTIFNPQGKDLTQTGFYTYNQSSILDGLSNTISGMKADKIGYSKITGVMVWSLNTDYSPSVYGDSSSLTGAFSEKIMGAPHINAPAQAPAVTFIIQNVSSKYSTQPSYAMLVAPEQSADGYDLYMGQGGATPMAPGSSIKIGTNAAVKADKTNKPTSSWGLEQAGINGGAFLRMYIYKSSTDDYTTPAGTVDLGDVTFKDGSVVTISLDPVNKSCKIVKIQ